MSHDPDFYQTLVPSSMAGAWPPLVVDRVCSKYRCITPAAGNGHCPHHMTSGSRLEETYTVVSVNYLSIKLEEQKNSVVNYRVCTSNTGPFQIVQMIKNLPAMPEIWVRSLCQEDPLEKGRATLSSILAWRIPWTEEPGITVAQNKNKKPQGALYLTLHCVWPVGVGSWRPWPGQPDPTP